MTTGDRVWWVHSEQASPNLKRHTIVSGRLVCVGNTGTAAVQVGDTSTWFVEASKLVLSLADAQYCLRVLEVPTPERVEPELCCIMPDVAGIQQSDQPPPEMVAGERWCRPISACEHDRKKTTADGWECRDCGLVGVYS